MKTYKIIWQGYLWMGIDGLKINQTFSTQECYKFLKKLAAQKKIRFSSCYQQELVCHKEIESFLRIIVKETNCLILLPDGKWKKIKKLAREVQVSC